MIPLRFTRRGFVKALGAGALVQPFLGGLPSRADGTPKRALILTFSGNGRIRHTWGADPGATPEQPMVLRPTLRPLAPYVDDLLVVKGLRNKAAASIGGTHEGGMASLWTGASKVAGGPSIDQYVAAHCEGGARPSLELRAVGPEDELQRNANNRMVFTADGTPVDPQEDVRTVVEQWFSGAVPGGGGGDSGASAERESVLRRSVLRHLDGQLKGLLGKVCTEDRDHLEAMRDGFARLEGRLGGPSGACEAPTLVKGNDLEAYPRALRDMTEVAVMAVACDLTRVVSLQWSQARSDVIAGWLGLTEKHHDLSHQVPQPHQLRQYGAMARDYAEDPLPEHLAQFGPVWDKVNALDTFYAEAFGALLGRLRDFPGANGGTLLSDVLVAWGSEIDNGSGHDHWSMPFVLAGGAGGRLARGKLVTLPVASDLRVEDQTPAGLRYHNDLLLTIAHVMGCPVSSFGDASLCQGPLEALVTG